MLPSLPLQSLQSYFVHVSAHLNESVGKVTELGEKGRAGLSILTSPIRSNTYVGKSNRTDLVLPQSVTPQQLQSTVSGTEKTTKLVILLCCHG